MIHIGVERVLVVIPTFRRPRLLATLLNALAGQNSIGGSFGIRMVVLDNDANRSAEAITREIRETFPFRLDYETVEEAGLASIRNRALDIARSGYDYLAMIDDDERPEPQWLAELLAVRRATGAGAVVGPVPSLLPEGAPRWLCDFRTRELPVFADRASLIDGWSGNCLLDMKAVATLGMRFDRDFNFAGGEDQLFFRQLVARGGRIAYAARAVAWEDMPVERQSLRFVITRSFRRGNTLALCDLRLLGRPRATAIRSSKAIATIARGAAKVVLAVLKCDESGAIDGACDFASAGGMIGGLVGMTYQAYRRPAPSRRVQR